jgi:hypothetical protein
MDSGRAALAAVEALIWQLVTKGYAGFSGDAAPMLQSLAHVARAGGFPTLVVTRQHRVPKWERRSTHHG